MRPAAPSFGQYFNPLPPRGGRHDKIVYLTAGGRFQSTPSSRRETLARSADRAEREISIHSLLAEGDYFTPLIEAAEKEFQSTPSSRRETDAAGRRRKLWRISIHSLLAEGDTTRSSS